MNAFISSTLVFERWCIDSGFNSVLTVGKDAFENIARCKGSKIEIPNRLNFDRENASIAQRIVEIGLYHTNVYITASFSAEAKGDNS